METENAPIAPTGIVLISIFWILIGTFILSITSGYLFNSHYYSLLGIIPLMISVGAIMLGWGLLTFKKWAYYIALIFSLLGLLPLLFSLPGMVYMLFSLGRYGYGYYTNLWAALPILFFVSFILMFWYLIKNIRYFEKKH
jgi:hypothetical protein